MPRFRTKPVEIEAIQFTGNNYIEIINQFGSHGIYPFFRKSKVLYLILITDDGNEADCHSGDWVIPDNKPNTFYPCNDKHFQKKYEKVTDG